MKTRSIASGPLGSVDPEQSLGFLLSDVARLLRRNFNLRLQSLGLTQAQCRAIFYLSQHQGIQQVALAEILEIQPITLGRLIDKLEILGLVERQRDPQDRRAFRLHLTSKAYPLLEKIWQVGAESRADMTGNLDDKKLKTFITTLTNLKKNLLQAENKRHE